VLISGRMHVDMDQQGRSVGVAQIESGLFDAFAPGTDLRRLARLQMTSWLKPAMEPAVAVEKYTALADHDGRCCDMGEVGAPVERPG